VSNLGNAITSDVVAFLPSHLVFALSHRASHKCGLIPFARCFLYCFPLCYFVVFGVEFRFIPVTRWVPGRGWSCSTLFDRVRFCRFSFWWCDLASLFGSFLRKRLFFLAVLLPLLPFCSPVFPHFWLSPLHLLFPFCVFSDEYRDSDSWSLVVRTAVNFLGPFRCVGVRLKNSPRFVC